MPLLQRTTYLDWLIRWKDRPVIKVVTGIRRSGKSTLFQQFIARLRRDGVLPEQIIHINLEDLDNANLLDFMELHKHVRSRMTADHRSYIFLDEVQNCKGFERVVDSLFLSSNADIYITGSNAFMLSGELATLLSGRYVALEVLPFSFAEYCAGHADSSMSMSALFNDYLRTGGFPFLLNLNDTDTSAFEYLTGIYNTILVKDVPYVKVYGMWLFSNVSSVFWRAAQAARFLLRKLPTRSFRLAEKFPSTQSIIISAP